MQEEFIIMGLYFCFSLSTDAASSVVFLRLVIQFVATPGL